MIPRAAQPGSHQHRHLSLPRIASAAHSYRADESLSVASTAIARLEYDPPTQSLTITFARDGSQYTLTGIAEIEAHRFATAESPGRYFNSYVRGRY
jgi:hypothetical protein